MSRNSLIIELDIPIHLANYGVAYQLYKYIDDTKLKNLSNSYLKYSYDIEKVFSYYLNESNNPEYQGPKATIELQAAQFRLSRQHMSKAKTIENISCYFKDIINYNLNFYENILIKVNNAKFIDRPSLMILNRLMTLTNNTNLKIDLHINGKWPENNNSPFLIYRKQLFNKLHPSIKIIENKDEIQYKEYTLDILFNNHAVLNASLLEQNYELVYLISVDQLSKEKIKRFAHTSLFYRYLGVISANLGDYNEALRYLENAVTHSENDVEYYRNVYIRSICFIKRKGNFDQALSDMNHAITEIKQKRNSEDLKFECSWLMNGMCLGKTMKALDLPERDREDAYVEIMQIEMEAYRLINHESHFKFTYLKYNLLANMAFLLEINKSYDKAIEFWQRAFHPILVNDNSEEAEKSLSYRLGIIHLKLGKFDVSQEYLERALTLTRAENNPFDLALILYGLAYNHLKQNSREKLNNIIKEGLELTKFIDDVSSYNKFFKINKSVAELNLENVDFPDIKLRSYVSFLDLSFMPKIDINKELVRNEV